MRKSMTFASEDLIARWDAVCDGADGEIGAALYVGGALVAARRAHVPHYAASTIKLAILAAALAECAAGRLDLDRSVLVVDEFPRAAGGSFAMRQADDQDDWTWGRRASSVAIDFLLRRMIVESSNIAANLVLAHVGFDTVRRTLDRAGAGGLTVDHFIGDRDARVSAGNRATADALARLLFVLAAGRLVPPADTERALALLASQRHRTRIPAGLPAGTWAAGKPGWTDEVEHDVAIVRPAHGPEYVLAVCTTGVGENAADFIAQISAETWDGLAPWRA